MISSQSFDRWTKNKREDHEEQLKQQIYDLWMKCETQENIASLTGVSRPTVTRKIENFVQSGKNAEMNIFRDFKQENSALRIYDIWNFSKATNEVNHFYILFFDFTTGSMLCLCE
jgi:phage regulator Rha-like protein